LTIIMTLTKLNTRSCDVTLTLTYDTILTRSTATWYDNDLTHDTLKNPKNNKKIYKKINNENITNLHMLCTNIMLAAINKKT